MPQVFKYKCHVLVEECLEPLCRRIALTCAAHTQPHGETEPEDNEADVLQPTDKVYYEVLKKHCCTPVVQSYTHLILG